MGAKTGARNGSFELKRFGDELSDGKAKYPVRGGVRGPSSKSADFISDLDLGGMVYHSLKSSPMDVFQKFSSNLLYVREKIRLSLARN